MRIKPEMFTPIILFLYLSIYYSFAVDISDLQVFQAVRLSRNLAGQAENENVKLYYGPAIQQTKALTPISIKNNKSKYLIYVFEFFYF